MHWSYFLTLEADVAHVARFIEPHEQNLQVFSLELLRLLLAISAEADVVSKFLVTELVGRDVHMRERREPLFEKYPWLPEISLKIPRYNLYSSPLKNWTAHNPLPWWEDYNVVKHKRPENFTKANLKNVLDALAGLFIFDLIYCRRTGTDALMPAPALLYPVEELGSIAICPDGQLIDLRRQRLPAA